MDRYVLPGDNVFPEGITKGPWYRVFVGSMGGGTIYRGDVSTGKVEVFLPRTVTAVPRSPAWMSRLRAADLLRLRHRPAVRP